jgi:hypothetical protein
VSKSGEEDWHAIHADADRAQKHKAKCAAAEEALAR